jgi:hypothetical protein
MHQVIERDFLASGLFQQASQSVRRMTDLFKPSQGKQSNLDQEYNDEDDFVEVDMADRVASLVSNSLGQDANQRQKQQKQQQQPSNGPGLFGGFMRLIGLDSTRLGAIAVNAFIYISEMVIKCAKKLNT